VVSATPESVVAPKERVGFVGLGTMGAFMAANLARAGFPLAVWNRTAGRADELVELGATEAPSAEELARSCDVVVACLTDSPQVEEVLFGSSGLVEGFAPGALFIDCSTLSPLKASEFTERLSLQHVAMLDAPVTGGSEGAKNATLSILVGRKDLGIGLDLAKSVGAVFPVTSLAATFEDGLISQGYGDDDNSALARPIRKLSGL